MTRHTTATVAATLAAVPFLVACGDSTITIFADTGAISGTSIKNVIGNGHTVTYNASLSANRALGGRTFDLAGGGTLKPAK